jgi:hypothetical protein
MLMCIRHLGRSLESHLVGALDRFYEDRLLLCAYSIISYGIPGASPWRGRFISARQGFLLDQMARRSQPLLSACSSAAIPPPNDRRELPPSTMTGRSRLCADRVQRVLAPGLLLGAIHRNQAARPPPVLRCLVFWRTGHVLPSRGYAVVKEIANFSPDADGQEMSATCAGPTIVVPAALEPEEPYATLFQCGGFGPGSRTVHPIAPFEKYVLNVFALKCVHPESRPGPRRACRSTPGQRRAMLERSRTATPRAVLPEFPDSRRGPSLRPREIRRSDSTNSSGAARRRSEGFKDVPSKRGTLDKSMQRPRLCRQDTVIVSKRCVSSSVPAGWAQNRAKLRVR